MDSALIITSMKNPLQHLRSIRAEDLPPNQQFCKVCVTPWGYPIHANGFEFPIEFPILLTCGCIAGSHCLERSFEKSARCPLCNTTIRIIAGVNAPRHHNNSSAGSNDRLRQLELRSGINNWAIPSVESWRERLGGDARSVEETVQMQYDLQEKLDVLNNCHGTFLSMRELEICISLVDFRLGIMTSVVDVLNAFFSHPLCWWESAYTEDSTRNTQRQNPGGELSFEDLRDEDLRDVLMLVNMRAGTSFLLNELEMVLALMNHVHGRGARLLDVLGVTNAGLYDYSDSGGSGNIDKELVGAFRTLDLRVGSRNAVEDLGDVFSLANL